MVCADVTLDELVAFHAGIEDLSYGNRTTIFDMGTPTNAVYCIRSGAVKMVRRDATGEERIVRVLKKGDVAGLESAFVDRHEYAAIAVGGVLACRIPIAHFRGFIAKHVALQATLLEKSQAALREAEAWLAELVGGTIPSRTRVARLLLRLREGDGDRIYRFSLEDMAAILGCTPETVSRAISELVRKGYLVKQGADISSRHFRGDIAALMALARGE